MRIIRHCYVPTGSGIGNITGISTGAIIAIAICLCAAAVVPTSAAAALSRSSGIDDASATCVVTVIIWIIVSIIIQITLPSATTSNVWHRHLARYLVCCG